MASTDNLEIVEIDPNQIGKVAAINTAIVAIDEILGGILTIQADDGSHNSPYTVPYAQGDEPVATKTAIRFFLLRVQGVLGADYTVLMPGGGPTFEFTAQNSTSGGHNVIIKVTGQTGVTLAGGKTQRMFLDGTDVFAAAPAV